MFKLLQNHPKTILYVCAILITSSWLWKQDSNHSKSHSQQAPTTAVKQKQIQLDAIHVEKTENKINENSQDHHINNIFIEKEAKARLLQISNSFAKDILYPENSKPIRNQDELNKYTPNQSSTTSRATNIKKSESPQISIKASKHQYFIGETIFADASIEGLSSLQSVKVSGFLLQEGKIVANANVQRNTEIPSSYQLSFTSPANSVTNNSSSLRLVAQFNIDQQQYEIGTAIRYTHSVANIKYVGESFVNSAYLHIPVFINTTNTGYHLVSANLYDEKNEQPLVHLSEEKNLLSQNDFIELKAHVAALKSMEHQGPYELRDILLTRMPSRPNYVTEYGLVEKNRYSVNGFPFSDYEDTPYTDESTQERLEFLNQLGESPN